MPNNHSMSATDWQKKLDAEWWDGPIAVGEFAPDQLSMTARQIEQELEEQGIKVSLKDGVTPREWSLEFYRYNTQRVDKDLYRADVRLHKIWVDIGDASYASPYREHHSYFLSVTIIRKDGSEEPERSIIPLDRTNLPLQNLIYGKEKERQVEIHLEEDYLEPIETENGQFRPPNGKNPLSYLDFYTNIVSGSFGRLFLIFNRNNLRRYTNEDEVVREYVEVKHDHVLRDIPFPFIINSRSYPAVREEPSVKPRGESLHGSTDWGEASALNLFNIRAVFLHKDRIEEADLTVRQTDGIVDLERQEPRISNLPISHFRDLDYLPLTWLCRPEGWEDAIAVNAEDFIRHLKGNTLTSLYASRTGSLHADEERMAFHVIGDVDAPAMEFNHAVCVRGYFEGQVSFESSTFKHRVDFCRSVFRMNLDFSNAKIEGALKLDRVKIEGGMAYYRGETRLDLDNAKVDGPLTARRLQVGQGTVIRTDRKNTVRPISARYLTVDGEVIMDGIKCGGIDLDSAEFRGNFYMRSRWESNLPRASLLLRRNQDADYYTDPICVVTVLKLDFMDVDGNVELQGLHSMYFSMKGAKLRGNLNLTPSVRVARENDPRFQVRKYYVPVHVLREVDMELVDAQGMIDARGIRVGFTQRFTAIHRSLNDVPSDNDHYEEQFGAKRALFKASYAKAADFKLSSYPLVKDLARLKPLELREYVSALHARFQIVRTRINGLLSMQNLTIKGNVMLDGIAVSDHIDLTLSTIGGIISAIPMGYCKTEILGDFYLTNTHVRGVAYFYGLWIGRNFRMTDASFEEFLMRCACVRAQPEEVPQDREWDDMVATPGAKCGGEFVEAVPAVLLPRFGIHNPFVGHRFTADNVEIRGVMNLTGLQVGFQPAFLGRQLADDRETDRGQFNLRHSKVKGMVIFWQEETLRQCIDTLRRLEEDTTLLKRRIDGAVDLIIEKFGLSEKSPAFQEDFIALTRKKLEERVNSLPAQSPNAARWRNESFQYRRERDGDAVDSSRVNPATRVQRIEDYAYAIVRSRIWGDMRLNHLEADAGLSLINLLVAGRVIMDDATIGGDIVCRWPLNLSWPKPGKLEKIDTGIHKILESETSTDHSWNLILKAVEDKNPDAWRSRMSRRHCHIISLFNTITDHGYLEKPGLFQCARISIELIKCRGGGFFSGLELIDIDPGYHGDLKEFNEQSDIEQGDVPGDYAPNFMAKHAHFEGRLQFYPWQMGKEPGSAFKQLHSDDGIQYHDWHAYIPGKLDLSDATASVVILSAHSFRSTLLDYQVVIDDLSLAREDIRSGKIDAVRWNGRANSPSKRLAETAFIKSYIDKKHLPENRRENFVPLYFVADYTRLVGTHGQRKPFRESDLRRLDLDFFGISLERADIGHLELHPDYEQERVLAKKAEEEAKTPMENSPKLFPRAVDLHGLKVQRWDINPKYFQTLLGAQPQYEQSTYLTIQRELRDQGFEEDARAIYVEMRQKQTQIMKARRSNGEVPWRRYYVFRLFDWLEKSMFNYFTRPLTWKFLGVIVLWMVFSWIFVFSDPHNINVRPEAIENTGIGTYEAENIHLQDLSPKTINCLTGMDVQDASELAALSREELAKLLSKGMRWDSSPYKAECLKIYGEWSLWDSLGVTLYYHFPFLDLKRGEKWLASDTRDFKFSFRGTAMILQPICWLFSDIASCDRWVDGAKRDESRYEFINDVEGNEASWWPTTEDYANITAIFHWIFYALILSAVGVSVVQNRSSSLGAKQ